MIFVTPGQTDISGGDGDDFLMGSSFDDVMRGGAGNDLVWGGSAFDNINGDAGTETGGAGPTLFHGAQSIGLDEVTNFSYAKGDRVELDPGTTYSVSQVGADTVIDMGGGNRMVLDNVQVSTLHSDWLFEGAVTHV
jgi:Ca2+-binding RTX toxin-like protein